MFLLYNMSNASLSLQIYMEHIIDSYVISSLSKTAGKQTLLLLWYDERHNNIFALSWFTTSEFFFARRDLFLLSTSILPRVADVISDTDKGKRSLRARKFASGKTALIDISSFQVTYWRTCCTFNVLILLLVNKVRNFCAFSLFLSEFWRTSTVSTSLRTMQENGISRLLI
jgi:hypothetical protein